MTSSTKATPVLEESAKIKDRLLKVQAEIEAVAEAAADQLLKTARRQLGYDRTATDGEELIDTRVTSKTTVLTPKLLTDVLPASKRSAKVTADSRQAITDILQHEDPRLIVIVGPCSIHDPKAALEYADHVKKWRRRFGRHLEVIMRAYIEKPRSE